MHPYAIDSDERKTVIFVLSLFAVALTYALHLLLTKTGIQWPWWLEAPSVGGVFLLLYKLFDGWGWRLKGLRKFGFVKIPDLNGYWRAEGHSLTQGEKYQANVQIRQTWTHISITMETEHSRSHSLTASILVNQPDGTPVSYEYRNEPKPTALPTMHAHRGTAILRLKNSTLLEGEYYSGRDRLNYGSLILRRKEME